MTDLHHLKMKEDNQVFVVVGGGVAGVCAVGKAQLVLAYTH